MDSKLKPKDQFYDVMTVIGGTLIFAISVNLFIMPLGFYNGGVLGAAQIIRTLLQRVGMTFGGMDISGVLNFLINLPLLFMAYKVISRRFFWKTVVSLFFTTVFLSAISVPKTALVDDVLASCLFGGIISGVGLGLTLRAGGSSGGADILGVYLASKYSDFSVGKMSLLLNLCIYILCAVLFELPTALYSVLYSAVTTFILDRIHYQNINMSAMVFTKDERVYKAIMEGLSRGVTYWKGNGAYTEKGTYIVIVVVSKYEVSRLKKIIYEIDENAFVIFHEGMSVSGNFQKRLS